MPKFASHFADALPKLGVEWAAADFPAPSMLRWNAGLAARLGIDAPLPVSALLGTSPDMGAHPIAMAYAGHQFGHYNPQLGDGRALLIGEIAAADGTLHDVHLKGSGPTPFSRGGDGKAALGPMLREYLMSEAMAALGIPTTRSLAILTSGETILRDVGPLPGAILVRTASSHIRVGTFQYAAQTGGPDLVRQLADYAIARHYPDCAAADNPYLALFESVRDAQAALIARWMSVGFVHGVMNSDNMTISGETIDYGPCAFIDHYAPDAVFSSIDHQGRYAFANQPNIGAWNLARLAESLLPLFADEPTAAIDAANGVLSQFADQYRAAWGAIMAAKLGLSTYDADEDYQLIVNLFSAMQGQLVDYAAFFRALAKDVGQDQYTADIVCDDPTIFRLWKTRWTARLAQDPMPAADRAAAMDAINPIYIPRNHLVEAALNAASEEGDFAEFDALLDLVSKPYADRGTDWAHYAKGAPQNAPAHVTFCGT